MTDRKLKIISAVIFLLALMPFFQILLLIYHNELGPDPAKKLALFTGNWAIRFLLLTLLISSLARTCAVLRVLLRWRRMIGLFAFFYATLHLFAFIALYLQFDAAVLLSEIRKRPYILVGLLAWVLLVPLAATSNHFSVRKLGGKRWKLLHRVVYLVVVLGIVHVVWQVRSSWLNAVVYGGVAACLMLERMPRRRKG